MKRFFTLLIAVVAIPLLFSACGGKSNNLTALCRNCSNVIPKKAAFCPSCGTATTYSQSETENTEPAINDVTVYPTTTDTSTSFSEETQVTTQPTETSAPIHIHSYSKTTTEATCTKAGFTTYTCSCGDTFTDDQTAAKGHTYIHTVTDPTCTEKGYTTYTCSCGDTYKDDYVNPAHKYTNNVCIYCGIADANYSAYQTEYAQLTTQYNDDVAALQSQIATSQSNIDNLQQAINNARSALASLSPSCPTWFRQQYIDNWKAYGDTYTASQVAQIEWTQHYNSQKSQLEITISTSTSKIQSEQTNISICQSAISSLNTQYNNNVNALKIQYGIS